MDRPVIIGVAGRKRAGKSSAISAIERATEGRIYVTAWASALYEITADMLGLHYDDVAGRGYDRDTPHPLLGGHTIRQALQEVGSTARRFNADVWVDRTMDDVHATIRDSDGWVRAVLVDGTRFPNEASAVDVVWWIDRPDAPNDDLHESETYGPGDLVADWVYTNDGSLEDLEVAVLERYTLEIARWGY